MTRRFFLIVCSMLLVTAGWTYSKTTNSGKAAPATDRDYREISQLYARFNQGSDFRDAAMWLSTFSDDGSFTPPNLGGQAIVGKKALTEWRTRTLNGRVGDSKRRHMDGSTVFTLAQDGSVKARTYMLVYDVSGARPTLASSALADDVIVKTRDGWKFKTRVISADAAQE